MDHDDGPCSPARRRAAVARADAAMAASHLGPRGDMLRVPSQHNMPQDRQSEEYFQWTLAFTAAWPAPARSDYILRFAAGDMTFAEWSQYQKKKPASRVVVAAG